MRAKRFLRQSVVGVLIGATALEGLYLASVNIFLNTRLAPASINRKPEKFEIVWRYAWSLWPGMVVLHGVETRGRSRRIEWYAHLDSVSARFHPIPLFHRTVQLTRVDADGVIYRHRRILPPGESPRFPATELPIIPASLESTGGRRGGSPHRKQPGQPWTVLADRIVCDVQELWLDRYRLTGPMRVETPMNLVVRGPMAFPHVRVSMASGDLRAGDETIFGGLGLDVDAEISPFVGKGMKGIKGFRFFRNLSGTFAMRSDDASLFFLEAYFRKSPWLHFKDRGGGRLVFHLEHGRLRPGSTLDVANDRVDLEFLDRRVTGKGVITGRIEEADGHLQSRVTARLTDFQLAPSDGTVPFARGNVLTVDAVSRAMDLSDPFSDLHVVVDLPQADLLDLAFYNYLIPPSSHFRFLNGTGTLRYHLEGSQKEHSLHGDIEFSVTDGTALFEKERLRGGFAVRTRLREASFKEHLFDLAGTRLEVRGDDPPWSSVFTLPRARMTFSKPADFEATLRLRMQDTRPILRLYDAAKGASRRFERLMIIENIQGGARLALHDNRLDLHDLDVTGKGLHALADLTFGKDTKKGNLYVRFHGFSLGIEMSRSGRNLKLIRPLHWYRTQQDVHRRKPRADSDEAP